MSQLYDDQIIDWLNQEANGKTILDELAEEFCEAGGEPQDAIYIKEKWRKKGTLDTFDGFDEFVEEAFKDACDGRKLSRHNSSYSSQDD